MIKNNRFSLTLINSILLIVFLLVIVVAISISVYISTQKVLDYNINQYFKQTNNITNIILDNEQKSLNKVTFEISKVIEKNRTNTYGIEQNINNIIAVDQIDLLFLRENDKITNFSNSLFDTEKIIEELLKIKLSLDNIFISFNIDDEEYLLLVSTKKIIDEKTGRVTAKLYAGKILNDNFSIINSIKEKASLKDIYIYLNDKLIATTSNNMLVDLSVFENASIYKEGDNIYFNRDLIIYNQKRLDLIFVSKNNTFELLKEDFIKIGIILLLFVVISFIILYYASNKYIIEPFSKLLTFAKSAKDNKNVDYDLSHVLEFDNFALDLKSIIDELRDLKERYASAIEGVQDGLWDLDLKTKKLFCSNRYLTMLGYNSNEGINSIESWKNSIHKEDYAKTLIKIVKHYKGKTDLYEDNYRIRCKNGSYKWIKVRGKIFFDEFNRPLRITGFHTDIDDIVNLQKDNAKKEQMLYQQSKLAAMGEMIGNIAHQWRQPLNVVSTIASSQIMQLELNITKKDETIKDLNKLIDTVQYLSKIIDKFRYFFNPEKELEYFYIDDLVKENLEIFESSYKSSEINLIINLEHTEVEGYKFELMQVIINIINNARDALLEKYSLEDLKYIFMKSCIEDNYLVIKIYDNGGGIKNSIKEKIYEPYFTTKHQSQGTGLGLYMSNEIVKKHLNGRLENETISFKYEDKDYIGEQFSIKLPL